MLDGLRGVAALAVVAYHFGGRSDLPFLFPHGFLAVDFFFVLSGFVMAHAYLGRLKRDDLTASRFSKQRLIRLLPMLVPGAVIGAFLELWRPGTGFDLLHIGEILLATILSSLAIPWPFSTFMEQTIFPINGPVWSLFFEIVASGLFLVVAKTKLSSRAFYVLVVVGFAGFSAFAFSTGTVDIGYWLGNWPFGFFRVVFSFFIGVLSTGWRRTPALHIAFYPLLLLAVMMVPRTSPVLDTTFSLVVIAVCFPLVIASASGCRSPQGWTSRLCDWMGNISYPLYAIHYPIVRAICFMLVRYQLGATFRIAVFCASALLLSELSYLAFALYDLPVRQALTQRFVRVANAQSAVDSRYGGAT